MTTYVMRNGELIEKEFAEPKDFDVSAPNHIRDSMDGLWHPATGRIIDSKSKFRQETKAAGCVEVGNQKDYGKRRLFKPTLDKRQRIDDIKRTIYELRNGRGR